MKVIDAKGLKCPEPLMLLHKAIYEAESGEEVLLISTDPMSVPDVKKFCEYLEHKLKEIKESDNLFEFTVIKKMKKLILSSMIYMALSVMLILAVVQLFS